MKIPQTFLPDYEDSEKRLKELTKHSKRKTKKEKKIIHRTQKQKKEFLEDLVKKIPSLMEEVREKMIRIKTDELYLEKGKLVEGYSASLELGIDSHLEFHHLIYKADLDEDGCVHIYDYLNTYPDRENNYYSLSSGRDELGWSFKAGKEMYECIKDFLEK